MGVNEWQSLIRQQGSVPETITSRFLLLMGSTSLSSPWRCCTTACIPWGDVSPLRCLLTVGCGSYFPMCLNFHLQLGSEIVTLFQLFEEKFDEQCYLLEISVTLTFIES